MKLKSPFMKSRFGGGWLRAYCRVKPWDAPAVAADGGERDVMLGLKEGKQKVVSKKRTYLRNGSREERRGILR
jgi:hypothetical protein